MVDDHPVVCEGVSLLVHSSSDIVVTGSARSADEAVAVARQTRPDVVLLDLRLPDMLASGWGRIVTISSSSAQSGAARMAHHVASKGGVFGLTKALAVA